MKELSVHARLYREKLLTDPYRPGYHFAIPDGIGWPGDSNGAFFADGTYHLMYLYRNHDTNAYHWGHMSSRDLLHWRHHTDCLTGLEGDEGCYSGGAFVDDDGTAYLTFWKFPAKKPGGDRGGIAIASARPPYEKWERITPIAVEHTRWGVIEIERDGKIHPVSCADPSNIWKMNGHYYMETGNLIVLNEYGRKTDSPEEYRGDWTDLFRSDDLRTWTWVKRFYVNPQRGVDDWPDDTEDDMCPSFMPLPDKKSGGNWTDKWLQTFIAHNKGAQYYIGEVQGETFIPQQHGRFSWKDNTYFAPENLMDDQKRQLSWSWLRDNYDCDNEDPEQVVWTGVYNFPRAFWYEGGILRMAPAEELDRLQFHDQTFALGTVEGESAVPVCNGESFRIRAEIDMKDAARAGFAVRCDEENGQRVEVYVEREAGLLVMDTSNGGRHGCPIREEAPFALARDEKLSVDLFVDKSVIEVYVNERQAICRRTYPDVPARAVGVKAISDGADFGAVRAWEMDVTNPF